MCYYPFASKIFALLYILIHGPHPIVCTHVHVLLLGATISFTTCRVTALMFIWFILIGCGINVPSLSTVRAFIVLGVDMPQRVS